MMEKQLKDYLHLYLGCDCFIYPASLGGPIMEGEPKRHTITIAFLYYWQHDVYRMKPILRPLSDMTQDEMKECGNMVYDFSSEPELNKWHYNEFQTGLDPEQFRFLLSKHFDLFELIEAGLAINKVTL